MNYWVLSQKENKAMDIEVLGSHSEAVYVAFGDKELKECGPHGFDFVTELGSDRKYWKRKES